MMEPPKVRPGAISQAEPAARVVAYFRNASLGNLAIQRLVGLGVPSDRLGVTGPDRIAGNQGMLLSIPCPDAALVDRVESLCRSLGADVHRRGP